MVVVVALLLTLSARAPSIAQPSATAGLTTEQQRRALLALFDETGHPLNQMIIKLYDAYCASYGSLNCHR